MSGRTSPKREAAKRTQEGGPSFFILVTTNYRDPEGRLWSAYRVAAERLAKRHWPLYANTPNRSAIREGDRCLIYCGGSVEYGHSVIAVATVASVSVERAEKLQRAVELLCAAPPAQTIEFSTVDFLREPKAIRAHLDQLDLIPRNKQRWGAALTSGCRRISGRDFAILSGEG